MSRKEFVRLMEENVLILDRLKDRLHLAPENVTGYPRNLMRVLVRLWLCGRARIKDIVRREGVSAPNLCAAFRKLERDGLVLRVADDTDRRNVWYSVTDAGQDLAARAMENFRIGIEAVFAGMSPDDEAKLTSALKTMNKVLKNME